MLNGLTSLAGAWSDFYGDHTALQTGVTFVHVGSLLVAGGVALASDRLVFRSTGPRERSRSVALEVLGSTHRLVVMGLALVVLSGLLLFLADLDTFLTSWLFWLKMGLVIALLGNGRFLLRTERMLEQDPNAPAGWQRLRRGAVVSAALWLLITLLGTALVNVG